MNCAYSMDLPSVSQSHPYKTLVTWVKGLKIHYRLKVLLWNLVDRYGKDGRVFPSVRTLATEINVSRSTIHRWLNQLESMNLLEREHRYRNSDGGQTSSLYVLKCDTGIASMKHQEQQLNGNVIHAPVQENVIYMELSEETDNKSNASSNSAHKSTLDGKARAAKDSVIASNYTKRLARENLVERGSETSISSRSYEPCELPSCSAPRDSQNDKPPKTKGYRIETERMKNKEYALQQYRTAVRQKWITPSERDRLSWFSTWSKCVRQWREGKVAEPGALLTSIVKRGLIHKFPNDMDEQKTLRILREMKVEGLIQ
jgi:GntR family transcriptional regulator